MPLDSLIDLLGFWRSIVSEEGKAGGRAEEAPHLHHRLVGESRAAAEYYVSHIMTPKELRRRIRRATLDYEIITAAVKLA
jgi:hypothetical protein